MILSLIPSMITKITHVIMKITTWLNLVELIVADRSVVLEVPPGDAEQRPRVHGVPDEAHRCPRLR